MRRFALAASLTFLLLAGAATSQDMPDCGRIVGALASMQGYDVTIPPAGPKEGRCVLDGARFRSQHPGWPDLAIDRLRLRQTATEVAIDLQGLRAAPRPSDREVDDRVRSLMRLQAADLSLRAVHDPVAGVVRLEGLTLALSGGTRLELAAEILATDLSPAALALGAVTRADLVWRNDGRFLRPLMDIAGEGLADGAGPPAVDAARGALANIIAILPTAAVDDLSRQALTAAAGALPQGRGKLTLGFAAPEGIGAARLGLAALSGEPLSLKSVATLLDGATITAVWEPGLAP